MKNKKITEYSSMWKHYNFIVLIKIPPNVIWL